MISFNKILVLFQFQLRKIISSGHRVFIFLTSLTDNLAASLTKCSSVRWFWFLSLLSAVWFENWCTSLTLWNWRQIIIFVFVSKSEDVFFLLRYFVNLRGLHHFYFAWILCSHIVIWNIVVSNDEAWKWLSIIWKLFHLNFRLLLVVVLRILVLRSWLTITILLNPKFHLLSFVKWWFRSILSYLGISVFVFLSSSN